MASLKTKGVKSLESLVHRPEPIVSNKQLALFDRGSDVKETISTLKEGKQLVIVGYYSNGLLLLRELKLHLKRTMPSKSFSEQRALRARFHELSNLALIEVAGNKLTVKKAPAIGWLQKLYPDIGDFLLPFVQVQGLNSAWQWYKNGISVPVLRNKMHPYYGVYFPTRFDHLILFDNWLSRYTGPKKWAIDVGIGSGVLALQLVKYGFQKVFGTDTNPNAIVGLAEYMKDTKLSRKIELSLGHLFGAWEKQTELIVFNPPWLPKSESLGRMDGAIYYPKTLFPEFFKEAKRRLLPEGKIVILFSNLAQITEVTKAHPIEKELAQGGRFVLEKCLKRKVKIASSKTTRDSHWRVQEVVELWVLIHNPDTTT